jgi:hypothetical protein
MIDGIMVDYFDTDEQKRTRVAEETERIEAIARLQGKPAPALHIREWVNKTPEATGKKSVYLFWNKNCGPSVGLLKSYDKQYQVLSSLVEVIGIHTSEDAENLDRVIQDLNIAMPIGVDEEGKTHLAYHVDRWPCSFLVNEDGTFAANMRGVLFLGNAVPVPAELDEEYHSVFSGK